MKKSMLSILSVLFFAILAPVYGSADSNTDKVYIEPSSIQFEKNCLFVNIGEQISQVKAIRCDEGGLFVKPSDLVDQHEAW